MNTFFRQGFFTSKGKEWRFVFSNKQATANLFLKITNKHTAQILKEFVANNYINGKCYIFVDNKDNKKDMFRVEANSEKRLIFIDKVRTGMEIKLFHNDKTAYLKPTYADFVNRVNRNREIEQSCRNVSSDLSGDKHFRTGLRIVRKGCE